MADSRLPIEVIRLVDQRIAGILRAELAAMQGNLNTVVRTVDRGSGGLPTVHPLDPAGNSHSGTLPEGSVVFDDSTGHAHAGAAGSGTKVDHGNLLGLSDDDHTGYARLAGRAGGQTLNGGTDAGEDLNLHSTAHGTKGRIYFGDISMFDEVNGRLGINMIPSYEFDVSGSSIHLGDPGVNDHTIYVGDRDLASGDIRGGIFFDDADRSIGLSHQRGTGASRNECASIQLVSTDDDEGYIAFGTMVTGGAGERVRILKGGEVGIGVTSLDANYLLQLPDNA